MQPPSNARAWEAGPALPEGALSHSDVATERSQGRVLGKGKVFKALSVGGQQPTPRGPLLLLLLIRFSRVRLCAIPQTAAHQAPPPLGFSRQEHWSGLPFPSPMHESEK